MDNKFLIGAGMVAFVILALAGLYLSHEKPIVIEKEAIVVTNDPVVVSSGDSSYDDSLIRSLISRIEKLEGGALGGLVHNLQEIFSAGIKAGTSETAVINSSGEWTGVINSSSALTVSGTATLSGATTISGTTTLSGTTTASGAMTHTANLTVGAAGTGIDFQANGTTTNKFIVWDASADDFIITDATGIIFGGDTSTADGFKFEFDGTNTLDIQALTAGDTLEIGADSQVGTDFKVNATSTSWTVDHSADTFVNSIPFTQSGTAIFSSTVNMNGDTTIGDATADTLTMTANFLLGTDGVSGTSSATSTSPTDTTCIAGLVGTLVIVQDTNGPGVWLWACENDGASSYSWARIGAN